MDANALTPYVETSDEVIALRLAPAARWHHSDFPHPLLTLDFDEQGELINIEAIGPMAKKLGQALGQVRQFDPAAATAAPEPESGAS